MKRTLLASALLLAFSEGALAAPEPVWVEPENIDVINPVAKEGVDNTQNVHINNGNGTYYAAYSKNKETEVVNKGNIWVDVTGFPKKQLAGVFVTGVGAKGTNAGAIYVNGSLRDKVKGIKVNDGGTGINEGLIYVKNGSGMYDQRDGAAVTMINKGTIVTDGSQAYGIVYNGWNTSKVLTEASSVIIAKNGSKGVYIANEFNGMGSNGYGKTFSNEGLIQVEDASTGIYSKVTQNQITNNGRIEVTSEKGVGVNLASGADQTFTNKADAVMVTQGVAVKSQGKGNKVTNEGVIESTSETQAALYFSASANQSFSNTGTLVSAGTAVDASKSVDFTLALEGNSHIQGVLNLKSDATINVTDLVSTDEVLDLQNNELQTLNVKNSRIGFGGEGALQITNLGAEGDTASVALTDSRTLVVTNSTGALKVESDHLAESGALVSVENAANDVTVSFDGAVTDNVTTNLNEIKDLVAQQVQVEGAGSTTIFEEGMFNSGFSVAEDGTVIFNGPNRVMQSTLELATAAPLALNRILMNNVRKRLGDIRTTEGTSGAWARYDGGRLSGSSGLENDFNTIQVGVDTQPTADPVRFGLAFSYTTSDTDYARGSADMDAYSLAGYGVWFGERGQFVDVVARMATAKTDMVVDGNKKGSMDNVALSLSGEFGWRFDVANQFYVEPQIEGTYTYVEADNIELSDGSAYKIDAVDSFLGRAGVAFGMNCPNNKGNVYVHVSAVHEFLGDAAISGANGGVYKLDGKDTWVEYGLGANFNLTKSTYVWADVERTSGGVLDEDYRGTLGVRMAF